MAIMQLDHVNFSYPNSAKRVLSNVTYDFEAVSYTHLRAHDCVERSFFEVVADVAEHPLGAAGIAEVDVIKLHDGHDVS